MCFASEGVGYLLCDVEVSDRGPALELPEHDGLVGLGDDQLLLVLVFGVLQEPRASLERLLVDSPSLVSQYLEHTANRLQQFGIGEDLQAHLHPLSVVGVSVFLLTLQERADDQRGLDRDLVEPLHIEILLGLHSQLGQRD